MKKFIYAIIIFFFLQNNLAASSKKNVIDKFNKIENISFNFIQTINGKDEKGECTIKYPKRIFCNYEKRVKKVLVSNGSTLVIKKGRQYFRYPLKSTPFEYLLDKNFLINKIKSTNLAETNEKYLFFKIDENNNNINVFFSKKNYDLVGWQIEDVYQNLAVTYIFNSKINLNINEKLFTLPSRE